MTSVVVFVVLTIGPVFSAKQDIRPLEAAILSEKIYECISKSSVINSDFNLDNCFKEEQYYVNASLMSFDSNIHKEIIKGSIITGVNCRLVGEGKEMEKYPFCLHQTYYVLIDNAGKTEKGKLELQVGVEKYDSNINY